MRNYPKCEACLDIEGWKIMYGDVKKISLSTKTIATVVYGYHDACQCKQNDVSVNVDNYNG